MQVSETQSVASDNVWPNFESTVKSKIPKPAPASDMLLEPVLAVLPWRRFLNLRPLYDQACVMLLACSPTEIAKYKLVQCPDAAIAQMLVLDNHRVLSAEVCPTRRIGDIAVKPKLLPWIENEIDPVQCEFDICGLLKIETSKDRIEVCVPG